MTSPTVSEFVGLDSLVASVLDEYRARLKRGERPNIDEYIAKHPEAADLLRNVLTTIELLDLSLSGAGELPINPESGTLGDFQLIREVGRGGMGIVYEAMQISLNRRVALKVLPWAAAMDPKQLQRFKNEALAAGSLRHEHIVHVYGVGCERGVHFYAMEFIEGQTLAQVMSERGRVSAPSLETPEHGALTQPRSPDTAPIAALSTKRDKTRYRAIAALVADAADALEHAHSVGIVHRDVKPGNLLLGSNGKIYVSDFGLARMASPGCEAGGLTMSGDLLGTLRYMAPEQALAKHDLADHRVDVYGLGCTLYELLTGKPAVRGEDKAEILKHIVFEEPVLPRKFDKSIPSELETITLKCLAKEPSERYAAAGEFAADLRRWLEDKPIRAKPPGWRERAVKWARRHSSVVSVAASALLIALIGLGVSTWFIWREKEHTSVAQQNATEAKKNALEQAAISKAVKEFLMEDLLEQGDVFNQAARGFRGDADLTVKEAITRSANRIGNRFRDQPLVAAEIHHTIANAYVAFEDFDAAFSHFDRSKVLYDAHRDSDHSDVLTLLSDIAEAHRQAGNHDLAIRLNQQILDKRTNKLGMIHEDTLTSLNNLASAYRDAEKTDLAIPLFQKGLALSEQSLGATHEMTTEFMTGLADAYVVAGNPDSALPLFERALAVCRKTLGLEHPDSLRSANNLAFGYEACGKFELAVPLYEQSLAAQKRLLGADNRSTLNCADNLIGAYTQAGMTDRAIALGMEIVKIRTAKKGAEHFDTMYTLNGLGLAYQAAGQLDRAVPIFERMLAFYRKNHGLEHPNSLIAANNLAAAYLDIGDVERATPILTEIFPLAKKLLGEQNPDTLNVSNHLAIAYERAGNFRSAIPLHQSILDARKNTVGDEDRYTLIAMNNLGFAYLKAGDFDSALPLLRRALELRQKKFGPDFPDTLVSLCNLAKVLTKMDRRPEALVLLEEAVSRSRRVLNDDHPVRLESMRTLGLLYLTEKDKAGEGIEMLSAFVSAEKQHLTNRAPQVADEMIVISDALRSAGHLKAAETVLRDCVSICTKHLTNNWRSFNSISKLGAVLVQQRQFDEAEPLLIRGYEGLKQNQMSLPRGPASLIPAIERIIMLYDSWGKPEKAASWRKELETR